MKVRTCFDELRDPRYKEIVGAEFGKVHAKDGSKMVPRGRVKMGRSRSSNLLQLADLFCGASRWDTDAYRQYVTTQCLEIRPLP